jgi:hypothetical protein
MGLAIRLLSLLLCAAAAATAVDVNVASDEEKKLEQKALAPREGLGYYDTLALEEWALVHAYRSPSGALWRSCALPGWGQLYNRRPIKAGAIMAAEGTTLGFAVGNYLTSRRYLREARAADGDAKKRFYGYHQDYVIDTEFWGWLFVGCVAYSMMDAYVDAHLSNWDVKDLPQDKPASSRVTVEPTPAGLSISIGFL